MREKEKELIRASRIRIENHLFLVEMSWASITLEMTEITIMTIAWSITLLI